MGFNKLAEAATSLSGSLDKVAEYQSDVTGLRVIIAHCKNGGIYNLRIVIPTRGQSDKGEPHCLEHLCFRGTKLTPVSGILDSLPCLASETNAYTSVDRTVYITTTASEIGLFRMIPLYLEHLHFPLLGGGDGAAGAAVPPVHPPAPAPGGSPSLDEIAEGSFATEVFHINEEYASAGVVFSEMETAFSEPNEIASYATLKAAYPEDSNYRWNTGGDPQAIPSLTLQDIRKCHQDHYIATNTILVLTGCFKNLDQLFEALEQYERDVYLPNSRGGGAGSVNLSDPLSTTTTPEPTPSLPPSLTSSSTSSIWAHAISPDIPSGIQLVTHSPSESDFDDHYMSYAFRLKFPWCNTKKRVAMDTALRYLVEGSGAILNKKFVEGENACAGSVDYSMDNVLWSLAVISFNDVEASQSLTMAQQITTAIRSHMAENFDLTRLRSILKRELWKQQAAMESNPGKACLDKLVSYSVNCYCQKDCSKHHSFISDGHDLKSVIDEISAYQALINEPETFWRNFIRSGIELSEKYVVIVKPSIEMSRTRAEDRMKLIAKRKAENVRTFSVNAHTAATEPTRKKDLEKFIKAFTQKNPPLMKVEDDAIPKCDLIHLKDHQGDQPPQSSHPNLSTGRQPTGGFKPAILIGSYESKFTSITIAASPKSLLDLSLHELHKRPECRKALEKNDLAKLYDEVMTTEINEDVTEAVEDLYLNPSWEKALAGSDDDEEEEEEGSQPCGELSSEEVEDEEEEDDDDEEEEGDSSDDDDDDQIEDLGSLSSDERGAIVAYQFDIACRTYLQWVLNKLQGKHLLHIVSKCIFYSHLKMPPAVFTEILRGEKGMGGGATSATTSLSLITPEMLETFLNANFLEYYVANGLEASPSFNSLLTISLKVPAEQFELALKTLKAVLQYTEVDAERLLAMAKQELSYFTEEFKQAENVITDLHDLDTYGGIDSLINCQSDLIQNILTRAIVTYPHVFAPLVNSVISEVFNAISSGDCILTILGDARACLDSSSSAKIIGGIWPDWISQNTTNDLPMFDCVAASNTLLKREAPKKRINLQWNGIEVGHAETISRLPDNVIPKGCEDLRSHAMIQQAAVLVVVEGYLRTTEGPIFQPVRDAGAAYHASMAIDEEGRTISLSLTEATQPAEALNIGLRSLATLKQNCDSVLQSLKAGAQINLDFPTPEQFARAKSGALFLEVKDLESASKVGKRKIEYALRHLPSDDHLLEKLSAVTFEQFVECLKNLAAVILQGDYSLIVVSNSHHATKLSERVSELPPPKGYVEEVASVLIGSKNDKHSQTFKQLLTIMLKARISLLSSDCDD